MIMLRVRLGVAAAAATSMLAVASPPALGAPGPTPVAVVELGGLPGGGDSVANAVNDAGLVVGVAAVGSGEHAVVWRGGRPTDLGTLGGPLSEATAVNPSGIVIGASRTAAGERHAFAWRADRMTDLGTLGGHETAAAAINAAGVVVGASTLPDGRRRGFRWSDGRLTPLEPLPGNESSAAAGINRNGQVVGGSEGPIGHSRPVIWGPDGTARPLELPGPALQGGAARITDDGQISGQFWSEQFTHAALWSADGGLRGAAAFDGVVMAMNGRGAIITAEAGGSAARFWLWDHGTVSRLCITGDRVVGNDAGDFAATTKLDDVTFRAALLRDGRMVQLPPLPGDTDSLAQGLNNRGDVVGVSVRAGHLRAVLWRVAADAPTVACLP